MHPSGANNLYTNQTFQATGGVILVLDNQPSATKSLLEMKVRKAAPAPAPGQTAGSATGAQLFAGTSDNAMMQRRMGIIDPQTPVNRSTAPASGAAAAAAVLNAVDEDDEDADEATVPEEFEYETDGAVDDD